MNFNQFQNYIARYADPFYGSAMPAGIRLGEETGEVLGIIKRLENHAYRGIMGTNTVGASKLFDKKLRALADELGDVLSAVACLCEVYGMDMTEIAEKQINKESSKSRQRGY